MTDPTSPLTWMDAVDQGRQEAPVAPLSVATLTPQIEAYYADQGLVLATGEAQAAAKRCLTTAVEPTPTQVSWPRPATVAQWHAQQARLTQSNRRWRRAHRLVSYVAIGGLAGGMGLGVWTSPLPMSLLERLAQAVFLGGLITVIGAAVAAVAGAILGGFLDDRLQPFAEFVPSPYKLELIANWTKDARMAPVLRQLRDSGVPLLRLDWTALDALRQQQTAADQGVAAEARRRQLTQALGTTLAKA